MKAVLLSVRPKWCCKMEDGLKSIEARKDFPRKIQPPFRCFIYMSGGYVPIASKLFGQNGFVVGEFMCDQICYVLAYPSQFAFHALFYKSALKDACLTMDEAEKYSGGKTVYGWHISGLTFYDKPMELSEFSTKEDCGGYIKWRTLKRPPQSWCYVEVPDDG